MHQPECNFTINLKPIEKLVAKPLVSTHYLHVSMKDYLDCENISCVNKYV